MDIKLNIVLVNDDWLLAPEYRNRCLDVLFILLDTDYTIGSVKVGNE